MNNNDSTPTISIISPVYNVGEYLGRFLNSVQSLTFVDYEIILVDDGSTDNSGAICDEYASSDCRFLVIHQPNAGVSAARNAGINAARGKYICFFDPDDEVLPDCLGLLVARTADDVGLVSGSFIKFTNDVLVPDKKPSKSRRYSNNQFIRMMSHYKERNTSRYIWTKLFVSSIIKSHHLQFDTKFTYKEDVVFMYDYLFHCDRSVACIAEPVYVYYRRSDGAAMSHFSNPNYTPRSRSYFYSLEKILEMAVANHQPLATMLLLKNELAKSYWRLKRLMEKTGDKKIKAESRELHKQLVSHLSPIELLLVNSIELYRMIRKKL